MVRKGLLVLVMAALVTGGTFAVDMSAGLGGSFSATFDSFDDDDGKMQARLIGGSIFAMFDATFVEASIGMMFGGEKWRFDGEWDDDPTNLTYLTIGLLGKYPIDIGSFTLFPMLGIRYDLGLSAKYDGEDLDFGETSKADSMNRFWIKLGAGADFPITDQIFIRPSFLYGINFGTKDIRDWKSDDSRLSTFHHGLDIRVAVGFRF
ncbi:MAG: PorT family protein [Treponema sp.]|nr:PorT family protein [Treponema sp.]